MTARACLPHRRLAERFTFDLTGIRYTATTGFDASGQLLEVFLAGGKAGSAVEAMARDIAVIVSIALQYGVPLHVMCNAITRLDDGSAAGPGGHMLDVIALDVIMAGTAP